MDELISKYIEARQKYLLPRTRVEYVSDLAAFESWVRERGKTLIDVSKTDISNYIDRVPVGGKTTRRKFSSIRMFYMYLWENEIIQSNPAERLTKRIKIPQRHPKILTPEKLGELFRACEGDILSSTIVKTFYYTGIRLDELVKLNLGSVNYAGRELTVIGKGDKERVVQFSESLLRQLISYFAWRESNSDKDETALFVYHGTRITYSQVEYIFTRLAKVLKFHVRPHLLRHTFASHALARGMTLPEVKEALGHSQVSTTSIYIHIVERTKNSYDKAFK